MVNFLVKLKLIMVLLPAVNRGTVSRCPSREMLLIDERCRIESGISVSDYILVCGCGWIYSVLH